MRRLAALALSLFPAFTAAQPAPPSWAEAIGLDVILTRMVQSAISAARTQADITYDHLSVSGGGQIFTMTGLEIFLLLNSGEDCAIFVDRVTLSLSPWEEIDQVNLRVDAIGGDFDATCIPAEARQEFPPGLLTEDVIDIDHAILALAYDLPSAGATLDLSLTSSGFAEISANAVLDYFAIEATDPDNPLPVMFLEEATVTLANLGLWEKVLPLLPPDVASPLVIGPVITQQMTAGLLSNGGDAALTELEERFVLSAGEVAARFLGEPERIVLEMRPQVPTYLDFFTYEETPRAAIADTEPRFLTAPSAEDRLIDVALVRAALTGGGLTDEERLTVGRALLTGKGAPQNQAAARDLLAPLIASADAETLGLLAETAADPAEAYALALRAVAAGYEGAQGLLSDLEEELALSEILAAQSAALTGPPSAAFQAQGRALREQALAYLTGAEGAPRNYGFAAALAGLSSALGDVAAGAILEELETRFGHDPAWRAVADQAAAQALEIWVADGFLDR